MIDCWKDSLGSVYSHRTALSQVKLQCGMVRGCALEKALEISGSGLSVFSSLSHQSVLHLRAWEHTKLLCTSKHGTRRDLLQWAGHTGTLQRIIWFTPRKAIYRRLVTDQCSSSVKILCCIGQGLLPHFRAPLSHRYKHTLDPTEANPCSTLNEISIFFKFSKNERIFVGFF